MYCASLAAGGPAKELWAEKRFALAGLFVLVLVAFAPTSVAWADHAAPTGLQVTSTTSTSVSLDWNDYAFSTGLGLGQFRVRLYNAAGTQIGRRDTGSRRSAYTYTGLTAGTTYRFAVAALSTGGHSSAFSPRVSATPGGTVTPPPPSGGSQPINIQYDGRITSNSLSPWTAQHCPGQGSSLTPMTDSTGPFIRARVDGPGQCYGGDPGSKWRAELKAPDASAAGNIRPGTTHYFDWSTRFPANFPSLTDPGSFCSAMQMITGLHATQSFLAAALSCHEPGSGPQFLSLEGIDSPTLWQASLQKGGGWHRFVLKGVFNDGAAGRVTLWYDPPGSVGFSKVVDNVSTDMYNPPDPDLAAGSGLTYWKLGYYRGQNDPAGIDPWIDTKGGTMSACHEIDPACG
jgi:hypothetical protein